MPPLADAVAEGAIEDPPLLHLLRADDVAGKFVPDITSTLTGLTNALADDFQRLSLNMCAKPI